VKIDCPEFDSAQVDSDPKELREQFAVGPVDAPQSPREIRRQSRT
jgi:hypothetical protein